MFRWGLLLGVTAGLALGCDEADEEEGGEVSMCQQDWLDYIEESQAECADELACREFDCITISYLLGAILYADCSGDMERHDCLDVCDGEISFCGDAPCETCRVQWEACADACI
jgi:hypothetical protein